MKTLRTLMSGTALALLMATAAAADTKPFQLAQGPAAQPAQAQDENARDRRRGDRPEHREHRERREERRDDRQRAQSQQPAQQPAQQSAPPPAPAPQVQPKLPPVSLPSVAAPQAAPPPAPPQAAAPRPDSERDRHRAERRGAPSANQAQVPPAPPASAPAAPAPQARTAPPPPPTAAAPVPPAPDARRAGIRDDFRREEWSRRRLDDVREQRTTSRENGRTVIREPGRTIVSDGNRTIIRHDDTDRLRAQARDVRVERRGADTVTTVYRPDGTRIVSVTDGYDRLIRRTSVDRFGREYVLIDNNVRPYYGPPPVVYLPPPRIAIPRERYIVEAARAPMPMMYETLNAPPVEMIERPYSLDEIRQSVQVRDRMPRIDVDTVNFETGSWMIEPAQGAKLADIANAMKRIVESNPGEMFLIEGHTDAVGGTIDNLSLSDRRAESVAMVLTEEFGVPPENLQTQGYGEELLKVQTQSASRENRRVAIRRITPLLSGTAQAAR